VGAVFKNSTEGGKPDLTDFIGFWKIQKKSVKFGKIQLKRTGDDRGTVKTRKTEIRPVSPINRPVFLENWHGDFRMNFARNRAIFAENR
jgi:hypothetical protein